MRKLLEKFKSRQAKILTMVAMTAMILTCFASADGGTTTSGNSGTSTITSTLTTSLSTVANDVMSVISAVLPYALTVVGAGLVVTLGIKIFKKVAGKA